MNHVFLKIISIPYAEFVDNAIMMYSFKFHSPPTFPINNYFLLIFMFAVVS